MATTIVSYTNIKGNRSIIIRGTVGTAVAKVCTVFEGLTRVQVINNDQTAANSVAVEPNNESMTTSTGALVYGGTTINANERVFFLQVGDSLNAVAGADRDVTFVITPNYVI